MMQNHLSLSTSRTRLSVSVSASASASYFSYPDFDAFTIDYLTINCGFTLKSAIKTARKLRVDEENIERSDAFVSLLQSHGFDESHICEIIQRRPILLNRYRVEENLKPKLEFLVESGFSGPHLHDLLVSSPEILTGSLIHKIKPSLHFLRSFLGTEERLKLALKRSSRLLSNNLKATVQPNIHLLLEEGVPVDALTDYLISQPAIMQTKVDRLVSALQIAKDLLNMRPTDPSFVDAVMRMACIGVPLWEKKLQVYISLGFSQQQAFTIYRRYPECIGPSEEKLRTKLGFYLNTVKMKRGDIISYPFLIGYAIETRIRPRHTVLKLLWSKKLLTEDAKIPHIFRIREDKFLSKYVVEHLQHVPSLLEMYNNDRAAK